MAAQKKSTAAEQHTCPNCGYCPHCGRSDRPQVIPMPFPQPYPVPYPRPYPRPYGPYWISQPTTICDTTDVNTSTLGAFAGRPPDALH